MVESLDPDEIADVWWSVDVAEPLDATLERRNDALLYLAGLIDFDAVTYEDISTAPFSSAGISNDDLADDTVVFVQTTEGRFTKFKVLNLARNLGIQWVTYE